MEPEAENPKCNQDMCQNYVEYYCNCTYPPIYLCDTHSHSDKYHRSMQIYEKLSGPTINRIYSLCKERIQECKEMKIKLNEELYGYIEKINNVAERANSTIMKLIQKFKRVIGILLKKREIRTKGIMSNEEKFIASEIGKSEFSRSEWKVPDINLGITLTVDEIKEKYENDYVKYNPKNLISYNDEESVFFCIDCQSGEVSKTVPVYSKTKCYESAGWCPYSDLTYYYIGGFKISDFKNSLYKIDLKKDKIKTKRSFNFPRGCIGQCPYYNGSIYTFGGFSEKGVSNKCEKYDIKSNLWQTIDDLPGKMRFSSTVVFKNKIFVAGFDCSDIFYYNSEKGTFKYNLKSENISNNYKIIFTDKNILYLFNEGQLLEYSRRKWSVTNNQTIVPGNIELISHTAKIDNFVYFLLRDNKIYRFSSETKEIKIINP